MSIRPPVITEAELAGALQELAVRTGNGDSYFPELARNIFEYVATNRRAKGADWARDLAEAGPRIFQSKHPWAEQ